MCKHCDWVAYETKAEAILEKLEELPSRATEFAEGVSERLGGMLDWIGRNKHITDPMIEAINNMETGVNNWIK